MIALDRRAGRMTNTGNVHVVGSYAEVLKTKRGFFEKKPERIAFDLGNVPAEELQPMKLELKRQMYRDITGTDPGRKSEKKLDKELLNRLAPVGADRLNIAVRSVNPRDLTKSYLDMMKDFEKKAPAKFQKQFMDSVISHFETLGPEQNADRQALAEGLFKVREQLPLSSQRKLGDLPLHHKAGFAWMKAANDANYHGRNKDSLDALRQRERSERDQGERPSLDSLRRQEMFRTRDPRGGLCR